MQKKVHILITSELGTVHPFTFSRTKLKTVICTAMVGFIVATAASLFFSWKTNQLSLQAHSLTDELVTVRETNLLLNEKVALLEYTVEEPLKSAVNELNERSRLIQSILNFVGVEVVSVEENDGKSQGGPYIQLPAEGLETLIFETDTYLKTIQTIPLGFPTSGGKITSFFGPRRDPFTKKKAVHYGIDIKNKIGSKIVATADGIVERSQFDSIYGRFVKIDHGNGFHSIYGHNKKLLVAKGDKVKRGQAIALLGNSGRSTGPHVHYELRFNGQVIDPIKYMKVAKLLKEQG